MESNFGMFVTHGEPTGERVDMLGSRCTRFRLLSIVVACLSLIPTVSVKLEEYP